VKRVAVCHYGAGNTRSVVAALSRLGMRPVVTAEPDELAGAEFAVLPGVGSARSAMERLTSTGAAAALKYRFENNRPTLGICLGMQLALEFSEEDGGVATLALIGGTVRRLEADRVPRIGWSVVKPWDEAYFFAHGFACQTNSSIATAEGVTAAVASGPFLGVQFHPEKSGRAGLAFLSRWLTPG
jgi:imidazole glycerol-phosphate synthase subunit HisH